MREKTTISGEKLLIKSISNREENKNGVFGLPGFQFLRDDNTKKFVTKYKNLRRVIFLQDWPEIYYQEKKMKQCNNYITCLNLKKKFFYCQEWGKQKKVTVAVIFSG